MHNSEYMTYPHVRITKYRFARVDFGNPLRYEKEGSLKRFENRQYASRKAPEAIKTATNIRSFSLKLEIDKRIGLLPRDNDN